MAIRLRAHAVAVAAFLLGSTSASREALAAPADCDLLPNPIYVTGSSASQPFLAAIGALLYAAPEPISIIYESGQASCVGVDSQISGRAVNTTVQFWTPGADAGQIVQGTCSPNNKTVTLGVSDVFPTSCPNVSADDLAGIGDFHGPIQAMTFVTSRAAIQVSNISAEAAYLTMGKAAKVPELPWNNPDKIIIRDETSGTQTMLGKAIRLPASSWIASTHYTTSGLLIGALQTAVNGPNPEQVLGILAETDVFAADSSGTIHSDFKILAFQPWGKQCAFLPDSSPTQHDRANVRNGNYEVFGPLHFLTKVDADGTPVDPAVAKFLRYITLVDPVPGYPTAVIDTAIQRYDVPQCAMSVTRDGEVNEAPIKSYTPDKPCNCYYDSVVTHTDCTPCGDANPCKDSNAICSYGYCETRSP